MVLFRHSQHLLKLRGEKTWVWLNTEKNQPCYKHTTKKTPICFLTSTKVFLLPKPYNTSNTNPSHQSPPTTENYIKTHDHLIRFMKGNQ